MAKCSPESSASALMFSKVKEGEVQSSIVNELLADVSYIWTSVMLTR